MTSLSIQARADGKAWEGFRRINETNTEALQRLLAEHTAQLARDKRLLEIDPNPDIALGLLLQSHQLMRGAQVVLSPAPQQTPTEQPQQTEQSAIACADEW